MNTTALIRGKIGILLNSLSGSTGKSFKKLTGYKLIQDFTPPYTSIKERVALYEDLYGKRVIIKKCNYLVENLNAMFLLNEAYVLKTLSKINKIKKIFPTFIKFINEKNQIACVIEYVEGNRLDTFTSEVKRKIIIKTYESLAVLSITLAQKNFYNLPVRKPFLYFINFPLLMLKSILKNPLMAGTYIKTGALFYYHYFLGCLREIKLGLSHRDLFSDNILYHNENDVITLLDWESAVITDNLYDLSQIAVIYKKDFGTKKLLEFLKIHLDTTPRKHRFIGLAIYNSMQILGMTQKTHPISRDTRKFLHTLLNEITPSLLRKKSLFEIINALTLDAIALFYKITGLPMVDPRKKLILCYHSIGNDGWRFSTPVRDFEKHVNFLQKNFKLETLTNLLETDRGGVNINFDDAYKNVITNALPILEKNNIHATVFALGNPDNANRKELDNMLPIMNSKDILYLKKIGWEIGFHTDTHANLGEINKNALKKEIIEGKRNLEKELGFNLDYFAYPRGIYSESAIHYVWKAGFKAAFTVDGAAMTTSKSAPLLLDRVPIEGELTVLQLAAIISPLGLFIASIYMKILTFKEKYFKLKFRYSNSY